MSTCNGAQPAPTKYLLAFEPVCFFLEVENWSSDCFISNVPSRMSISAGLPWCFALHYRRSDPVRLSPLGCVTQNTGTGIGTAVWARATRRRYRLPTLARFLKTLIQEGIRKAAVFKGLDVLLLLLLLLLCCFVFRCKDVFLSFRTQTPINSRQMTGQKPTRRAIGLIVYGSTAVAALSPPRR